MQKGTAMPTRKPYARRPQDSTHFHIFQLVLILSIFGVISFSVGGARYELFGVNPGTNFWMAQPITSKSESAVAAAIRSVHGPNEDMTNLEIRSDNANELVSAIESSGSCLILLLHTGPTRTKLNGQFWFSQI